ncbi:MAG: HNH endonuclease, partial [Gammaproteobacteria bacterium]|nr:HNH endonuclease [Gammaproteobacteria bacterium]
AMRSLPQMRARWAAGELTYSVVRELTRVATPEVEGEWLKWAAGAGVRRTVREVAQTVSRHRPGAKPSDPPAPFEEQTVTVALRMSGSEAARYSEARAEATRRLGHSVDDETFAKMLLDAFLRGGTAEGDAGRAPNQVRMTVCERCGATERQAGAEGLVAVHPRVGEAALCDAQVLREGERAAQTVPPKTRRAVLQRDENKCAVPGCRHASFVDVHHVIRRADGGTHDASNLVTLCSVHHDAAHEGLLVIRPGAEPETFRFERADGQSYGTITKELSGCNAAAGAFVSAATRTGSERHARLEVDETRRETAHAGRNASAIRPQPRASVAHVGHRSEAGPAIPVSLLEQVVGLLTSMGFKKHESRTLVERAIAGTELPSDRAPTTVELLRASLRANVLRG